mmetsp:Transcript_58993/g.137370  ORF Transcript_58993/g.137370 Transcript_58993/m.137370 type:complete len:90 (+) Transcript_58993:1-270(+)
MEFAPARFRHSRNFVLAAVEFGGCALKFASDKLRADRHVVLRAACQDRRALEYASPELLRDRQALEWDVSFSVLGPNAAPPPQLSTWRC